jgi:porin
MSKRYPLPCRRNRYETRGLSPASDGQVKRERLADLAANPGRVIGAPADRNLVDFYAEGRITFSGMIPHRADDSLGIGFSYTGVSDRMHGFDIDSGLPVAQNYEAVLEICYTMQLKSGWTLQPDFQYFWQPGANVP